jgi:hypothetical protein
VDIQVMFFRRLFVVQNLLLRLDPYDKGCTLSAGSITYRSNHSLVSIPWVCRMISKRTWAGSPTTSGFDIFVQFNSSINLSELFLFVCVPEWA